MSREPSCSEDSKKRAFQMKGTAGAGVLRWEYAGLVQGTARSQCDQNLRNGLMTEGKLGGAEVCFDFQFKKISDCPVERIL